MIHNFTVYLPPKPQSRPRFARRGNFVSTYEDKDMTAYKKEVAYAAKRGFKQDLINEPVEILFKFFIQIPKSATKKFRNAALQGLEYPAKKPDVDNLVKAVLDAINAVVIKDDNLVVRIQAEKLYAEEPRTEVIINAIKTDVPEAQTTLF